MNIRKKNEWTGRATASTHCWSRPCWKTKAVSDATTNLTIDPNLRASGSILARQEMVVAGLGAVPRLLEIFARLDPRPAGAYSL